MILQLTINHLATTLRSHLDRDLCFGSLRRFSWHFLAPPQSTSHAFLYFSFFGNYCTRAIISAGSMIIAWCSKWLQTECKCREEQFFCVFIIGTIQSDFATIPRGKMGIDGFPEAIFGIALFSPKGGFLNRSHCSGRLKESVLSIKIWSYL